MIKENREQNIKRIIAMEDRILSCNRCKNSLRCVRKPSLGKGDLEPEAVLVFESDNNFTGDINNIIEIRQRISAEFGIERLYHTFLVRCQPKSCILLDNVECYGNRKMINKDYICILNSEKCSGIPIKPSTDQIISCMPFTIEEIDILKPKYVFLFGSRVADFILKAWGIFDEYNIPAVENMNDSTIILIDYEEYFDIRCCEKVKMLLTS